MDIESIKEAIAQAVEQSAFRFRGTEPIELVPSASGEPSTRLVADYIRGLVLEE